MILVVIENSLRVFYWFSIFWFSHGFLYGRKPNTAKADFRKPIKNKTFCLVFYKGLEHKKVSSWAMSQGSAAHSSRHRPVENQKKTIRKPCQNHRMIPRSARSAFWESWAWVFAWALVFFGFLQSASRECPLENHNNTTCFFWFSISGGVEQVRFRKQQKPHRVFYDN